MIIYYNPNCSKCKEATHLLEQNSCDIQFREYLKEPPDFEELKELLQKLNCDAFSIVRRSEPLFEEKFSRKIFTNDEWIQVLCENPVLIERPIVVDGERAIIGRPPVLVLDLLKDNT